MKFYGKKYWWRNNRRVKCYRLLVMVRRFPIFWLGKKKSAKLSKMDFRVQLPPSAGDCNYFFFLFLIRSLTRKKVKWFFEQRLYIGTLKKKETEKKRWRHWDELETSSSWKDTNRNLVLVKINKTRSIIQYNKIINIFHENLLSAKDIL